MRGISNIICSWLLCLSAVPVQAGLFDNVFNNSSDCCIDSCCDDTCCDDDCCWDACLDSCCDDGCCCGDDLLLGIFASSDHCFDDFISPMTNPVFFEDPRTLTELRPIYIHHVVPQGVGGGEINLMAVQIRAALTDRVSLVAAKDGYLTSSNAVIDDGWADVSLGLKYTVLRDTCSGKLLSVGATYELPVGSHTAAQGNGDGEFHLYATGGTRIGDNMHYLAAAGLRLPADAADESKSMYLSQHLDYMVSKKFYLLTEMNWYSWFQGGNRGVPGLPSVEGLDLFNLGAPDVAGNNIITMAWGAKYKPTSHQEIGLAYEIPISSRNDVLSNRLTVDYIIRY